MSCPVSASLDAWSSHDWTDGVQIETMPMLATLVVHTCNSTYEMTLVSPRAGDVLVRGGAFFSTPTRAYLSGSSLGGSFLKCHGTFVGFRMEFQHDGLRIVTTAVRSIATASDDRFH